MFYCLGPRGKNGLEGIPGIPGDPGIDAEGIFGFKNSRYCNKTPCRIGYPGNIKN